MGTKRQLSPQISKIISTCRQGLFLDAFAGMCSIGCTVGSDRQVWSNDLQVFSNTVATALFCSKAPPAVDEKASRTLWSFYAQNLCALKAMHGPGIEAEARLLKASDHRKLYEMFEFALAVADHPSAPSDGTYDLFTRRYAWTYFSVPQAMEIDSLRFAIDASLIDGAISADDARWLLIGLAGAMNRCTTSTGHFAQPLAPKASNIARVAKERSQSIWINTFKNLSRATPIGTANWRAKNRVFNSDAKQLITDLSAEKERPAIVYADPPYTDDQYSRYYHLYETLVLYDYPPCFGRGRYRPDRARSDFSLPAKAKLALSELIKSTAQLGADLVLSYPSKGLLDNAREEITALVRQHYAKDPDVVDLAHLHSTMGGSTGIAATSVTEQIFKVAA